MDPKAIHHHVKSLYQSVFWPAVAGNVFWSACTLLIGKDTCLDADTLSSLVVLLIFTVYLSIEWIRNYALLSEPVHWSYWLFDAGHLCAIVAAGIAAVSNGSLLAPAIAAFFAITAVGHVINVWQATEVDRNARRTSLMANILGITIVCAEYFWPVLSPWNLPVACLIALLVWARSRQFELLIILNRKPMEGT